jgi:hypothetical protein
MPRVKRGLILSPPLPKAILKVRKSGFKSDDGVSDAVGLVVSHDQTSERGSIPTANMVRLRVEIQNIIPCHINQLLNSILVDSVFRIMELCILKFTMSLPWG